MMARSDIDWAEVRRLSEAARAVRGAAAGMSLAGDLFHVDVPAPFQVTSIRRQSTSCAAARARHSRCRPVCFQAGAWSATCTSCPSIGSPTACAMTSGV